MRIEGDESYNYREERAKERYYENKYSDNVPPIDLDDLDTAINEAGIAVTVFTWVLGIVIGAVTSYTIYIS